MRAKSVTEQARRAQIADAAILVIAEVGLAKASFARIAARAGLSSTGLISYHFAARSDLLAETAERVVTLMGEYVGARMGGIRSPREALESYLRATMGFFRDHPAETAALREIFLGGGFAYGGEHEDAAVGPLEQILTAGQKAGDVRDGDVRILAAIVQRTVDGLPFLLLMHPDIDPDVYADEAIALLSHGILVPAADAKGGG